MLQWEDRLAAAETYEGLLFVASDFLASLDYLEIPRLPRACRPRPLTDAAELAAYMSDLVGSAAMQAPGSDSAELVLRLLMFFSRATERLACLDRAATAQGAAKRSA